ncbi:MAG: hypothetical protein M1831_000757 [Alyxoria varia]|nr:MAG: hypothetical protein M1831_000757 [Alyxoria varia]
MSAVDDLLWNSLAYYMNDEFIDLSVDLSIDLLERTGTLPGLEVPSRQFMNPAKSLKVIDRMLAREDGRFIVAHFGETAFENSSRKNALLRPILMKSIEELRMLLETRTNLIESRGPVGDLPIHWCATWPEGLLQLLSFGAEVNVCDGDGWAPLHYAIICKNAKSVDVLLKAKSRLHFHRHLSPLEKTLDLACEFYDQEVFRVFVGHLAYRRRLLQEMAETHLSFKKLTEMQMPTDKVLDGQLAKDAESLLLEASVEVEPYLLQEFPHISVYHLDHLNLEAAQQLYDAGFHDVDLEGLHYSQTWKPMWKFFSSDMIAGRTEKDFWDLAVWLWSRGASINGIWADGVDLRRWAGVKFWTKTQICGDFGLRLMRRIRSDTNHPRQDATEYFQNLSPDHRSLISSCFRFSEVDGCSCACSSEGCLPVTDLVDSLIHPHYSDIFSRPFLLGFRGIGTVLDLLLTDLRDQHAKSRIALEAVRYATFHRLGITHTCHHHRKSRVTDYDDHKESREGKRTTVQLLETFMQEFEAKLDLEKMSLERFFYEVWEGRMVDFFEETRVNEDGIRKAREVGVIFT